MVWGVIVKKFNPNKNIIITLIVVIIIVVVVSISSAQRTNNGKTDLARSAVNDGVGLVDRVLSFPLLAVGRFTTFINDLLQAYEENEQLKAKIDSYGELALKNKNYEKEIDALKKELQLNETLTNYEKITANVITRSPDTWQDILVVDKGSNEGIEPNMAVLSQKGIIGRVLEVNANSSKIELLTSTNQNSNHFPVMVSSETGESYGLMKDFNEKEQSMIVSQLTGNAAIKEGDIVQTSGLGGNSPASLPIGTVLKVEQDSYGLTKEVHVKPYADMYGITVVTVVKRLAGGS